MSLSAYVSTPEDQLKAGLVVATGASTFLGFFLLLPQFKDSFRGNEDSWNDIYPILAASQVSTVTPTYAADKIRERKAVLLDVRLAGKYQELHPARGRSVPLYRSIVGWDPASTLRRAGFLFFGVSNSERDPNFLPSLFLAAPSKSKEVILICESGGSLTPKPGASRGFQSRSLKAAYYLIKEGYRQVSVVEGGFQQWVREGLDVAEGDDSFEADEAAEEGQSRDLVSALIGLFGRKS